MSRSYYQPLSDGESNDDGTHLEQLPRAQKGCWRDYNVWSNRLVACLNICVLTICLLGLALLWSRQEHDLEDVNWILQQTTFYTPLLSRQKLQLVNKVVSGSLFAEKSLSPTDSLLRSPPSPEVDQAWEALTNIGIFSISASEVRRLGKNPLESVKAPLEWGLGSEAYLAQSAGQHALHCLNAVRKYAYREYYYPNMNTSHGGDTSPLSAIDQAHLSHCLHILLQELTCTPSMNVITHNWVETQDFPFPDFAINKKCFDHKQLLQWQSRNSLSDEQWKEMARRGPALGEIIKPMPDQLLKWSEHVDSGS